MLGSGIVPSLAGKLGGGLALALLRRGWGDRFLCSLRPDPAAAWAMVGGRGIGPALAGNVGAD